VVPAETEVNGDSMSTNERGPFLLGSLGLVVQVKETIFQLLCPHRLASWAGSRAGSPVSYYCIVYVSLV
jgi:hypothetical protein